MAALQRLKEDQIAALVSWYKKNQRDFPWRKNPDPYWVWLAEIMSQQTQMSTLVPYFHRFLEKFATLRDLACATEEQVLSAWTGLGYYSRARNVHRAAQKIVNELKGIFPSDLEGLLSLPGVGPYTAAAVASQCFGIEEPVWDGNVNRVCARLDAREDVWNSEFRAEMENALREKMRGHNASDFNQALMELGATVCTPSTPRCGKCPIQNACLAVKSGEAEKYPRPKPRKSTLELKCRVWISLRQSPQGGYEALLERRPQSHWFGGMWDFQSELGGSEKPIQEIHRPIQKKGGAYISLGKVRHHVTHHKIVLEGWAEKLSSSTPKTSASTVNARWITLDELTAENPPVPLSTTARKLLRPLMQWVQEQG